MESLYYILIPAGTAILIFGIRKWREHQWGWVKNKYSLKDKMFIITGANTGLGFETAKALAERDAKVVLACRTSSRALEAIAQIRQTTAKGELVFEELDLSSFQCIKSFAKKIRDEYPVFDCIINNAGLAVQDKQFTKENFEIHFGVNHLGHFLLIDCLKDLIKRNNSRIVIVSSKMHEYGEIDFENLGNFTTVSTRRRNPYYNNSKLMNFYFAHALYKRGYDVHVLCPGLCHTDFFRNYNPRWYHYVMFAPVVWLMLRSASQGAQNIIFSATENVNTEKENPAEGYFIRNLKQTKSAIKLDDNISERLWNESLKLCTQNIQ